MCMFSILNEKINTNFMNIEFSIFLIQKYV